MSAPIPDAPSMLTALADGLAAAVAIVGPEGHVEFANRAMRELLGSAWGLRVVDQRLAKRDRRHAPLVELVRDAAMHGNRRFARWEDRDGRLFEVCVLPLPRSDGRRGGSGLAVLVLRDTAAAGEVDPAYLASVFGLTLTEARLTRALCTGHSLDEAAQTLSIARETARTHLKRVYAKTGVRRQVDLVRLATGSLHAHLDLHPRRSPSRTTLCAVTV